MRHNETISMSIHLEDSITSVIGKIVLQYSINRGDRLRRIRRNKNIPDQLNQDVWSHVIDYLGVRVGVSITCDIYFANLHAFWEPIWVVVDVETRVNGLGKCLRPSPQMQPLRPRGWPLRSQMFIYTTNIVREMNRKSLGCPYRRERTNLVTEYNNFTSYMLESIRVIVPQLRILLSPWEVCFGPNGLSVGHGALGNSPTIGN